jgi:hypothetical protein
MDENSPFAKVVQPVDEVFTEEALRSQDGKEVPLRYESGGPIIGKAKLSFDSDAKALMAEFTVDDPLVAGFLKGSAPKHYIGEAE